MKMHHNAIAGSLGYKKIMLFFVKPKMDLVSMALLWALLSWKSIRLCWCGLSLHWLWPVTEVVMKISRHGSNRERLVSRSLSERRRVHECQANPSFFFSKALRSIRWSLAVRSVSGWAAVRVRSVEMFRVFQLPAPWALSTAVRTESRVHLKICCLSPALIHCLTNTDKIITASREKVCAVTIFIQSDIQVLLVHTIYIYIYRQKYWDAPFNIKNMFIYSSHSI